VQPIRPDLADALRPWLANKTPGAPVFGNLTKHTNILIQSDLARAGIPYRDDSGRVADFHALRHSYVTALAMSRAPVKVVQSLARHSTLTLGIYAHVGLFDQVGALDALPAPGSPAPGPEAAALAATGTDGQPSKGEWVAHWPRAGDGTERELAVAVGNNDFKTSAGPEATAGCNSLELAALDGSRQSQTERRGWDSNPRSACTDYGFQDRPNRPLWHPSGIGSVGRLAVTGPPR
jgi:hypothetical protein